jgi:hypothetical protein
MLQSSYARAVEKRLQWMRWAKDQSDVAWEDIANRERIRKIERHIAAKHPYTGTMPEWLSSLPAYKENLETADSYFMNRHFCELVEHARKTIPDNISFDSKWLQSKSGWMWIETPFDVPQRIEMEDGTIAEVKEPLRISAIGWMHVPEGTRSTSRVAGPGAYMILTYQDFANWNPDSQGFGCWSYFMLQDGDLLGDRVAKFENESTVKGGRYYDRSLNALHEIRWVYAALYLMSQRLTMRVAHPIDRHTRKRMAKQNTELPPILRVISLRRMEQERPKGASHPVDWQWKWEVRGHWRNQFCPSTGDHKPVFIEAYIKGPEEKPLKPPGLKLFVARR